MEELKDRGFAVADHTASEAAMTSLAETWGRWANDQETPKDGRLQLSSADFSETVNEFLPMLRQLITKEVEDTLESYFESYSRIINFHIYRNTKPFYVSELDAYGSTGHWHTDGSTSESIKLFFMLSRIVF